ncbi:hypothetical protein AWH62_00950 [Maricaulis sp. W15]|uniref:hypothetical protein n=1 Tax=Maricaulis sp. W15 TaxID=1772333 RepID=UPI0009490DC3|nr:hypothetical protein [Maricaulis sp. W15]OLF81274.1 hypothetical protein AWH62_00950 [Maricaulis sp. W15]
MRVKIGDDWFDSDHQPICIELSEAEIDRVDRFLVNGEDAPERKFACFPDDWGTSEEMIAWMD